MIVPLIVASLILAASAVPQAPEFVDIAAQYGELDFVINSTRHHSSSWQRCHGDPHGQVAPDEFPDPRADDTLSFDFPTFEDGELDLVLWQHRFNNLVVIGTVTDTRLRKVQMKHPEFEVVFRETIIQITVLGVTETRYYDIPFDFSLPSDGDVNVTGEVLYNADFRFRGYHFVVTKPNGIYSVNNETEFGMAITLWGGDPALMVGLIGQLSSYDLYLPFSPTLGDQALVQMTLLDADGNYTQTTPFLTTLTHHLGMYKTCWHYEQEGNETHAMVGDFGNFHEHSDMLPCSVIQRPIRRYPDLYRGSVIFVDFPFQCSGPVTGLEFYAQNTGPFYLSVWRPSPSGDSWTLIGYNHITAVRRRRQIFSIPEAEQIEVEATDVIGLFYPQGNTRNVIPSKNMFERTQDGSGSRFLRTSETDADLVIGVIKLEQNLAGEGNTERIIPVNPIIG